MRKTKHYTVKQAAARSGISQDKLMLSILTGDIKATRKDGMFYIASELPKETDEGVCHWVWHDGEYTPVLAHSKEQALNKFRADPENKGKNPYCVWCVSF